MKQYLLLTLGCVIITSNLQAQQLKGIIVNKKGEPVPNSTVYIHDIAKGIAADNLGEFQTALGPGSYTCEFRSLGYESVKKDIIMGNQNQTIRVELQEKSYLLKEVVVYATASNEDPAYRIMRKAIAHAPYYRYQIKEYTSEAYIKGSLTVDKIPGIFKRAMKVNGSDFDINAIIGKPLVMESKSNIRFTSPDTYQQNVTALKSSIPKEFNVDKGLSIMTSSIYNAELNGKISPLAPGAFRFYAFKLENVDYRPEHIINKIKVTPRKKNPNLFSGHIYILEDTWNIYIADLVASELGTTLHYRINYHQVQPSVYLPTTYDVTMTINTMGVKGSGKYYASMKYNSVQADKTPDPAAINETALPDESEEQKIPPEKQKISDELDKLAHKEDLSTKEAYKMSRLMSRMREPEEVKKQRESLEIKDIEKVKMNVDTLAWKRDSTYWAAIRELPLREDERRSYQTRDSLSGGDTVSETAGDRNEVVLSIDENPKTVFGKITQGGVWKMNRDLSLRYGGLTGGLREYNFTDGLWLGQTLSLNWAIDKNRNFSVSPSLYYATARKEWLWHFSTSLIYAPMSLGQFQASAGHISRDLNSENGESRLMNTLAAIDLGQNFIRFYDSRHIKADHHIDIANGLHLYGGAEIDKRSALRNRTSFNFIGKDVPENIPAHATLYPNHTATNITVELSYTPRYRYRVREGRKWYVSTKYPTFSVLYKKGVDLFPDNAAPLYERISASISQTIKVSPFEEIDYLFSGGTFLSSDRLYLNDLKYFRNNQMLFTASDFNRSFNLLEPYTASGEWWMEGHLNYQSQYLFLKNLPFLQRFSFDEALHIHGLSTENRRFYLEGGYSIGFLGLGRAGIFTGFTEKKFDRFGVRLSYPLWNLMEKPIK
ncbi:DUF5686 family protein [Proteiniphilum sp. X52]|uniref:DUF5686 family protein n=1 Tax=Proteiniphilum sp. X52 TaxID=2382159 RepID=UPI000F0A4C08|nr:DUF5686 family protein [Proteiniphilum sp. X52]RNC66790.1 carboxypeptidase-like regulatory domain-containing protein [Proteiniphilum sp. X52]